MFEGSVLQWISAVASSAAVGVGVRIIFMAGRLVERVDDHSRRLEHLEKRVDAL